MKVHTEKYIAQNNILDQAREEVLVQDSEGCLDKDVYYNLIIGWMRTNTPSELRRRE